MRKGYKWANETYTVLFKDGKRKKRSNTPCYSHLRQYLNGTVKEITIHRTKCDKTLEYREEYLQYIADMLKLDAKIGKNSFKFKAFKCNNKNMAVCSLVRMLWENIGYKTPPVETHEVFLEPLLRTGKSKYRNKLKRFCDFYHRGMLPYEKWWHTGHSWNPKETKIKSTQQFIAKEMFESVNGFFTNE